MPYTKDPFRTQQKVRLHWDQSGNLCLSVRGKTRQLGLTVKQVRALTHKKPIQGTRCTIEYREKPAGGIQPSSFPAQGIGDLLLSLDTALEGVQKATFWRRYLPDG